MRRGPTKLSLFLSIALLGFAAALMCRNCPAVDTSTELHPAIQQKLHEKVLAPFAAGNMALMVDGIGDMVTSSSPELLASIDEHLIQEDYASLGEMATSVWVQAIEQGTASELPKLNWQMAVLVFPRIQHQIADQLNRQKQHPLMRDLIDCPEGFNGYEDGLWDLHVFEKQLDSALNLARAADKLIKPFQRKFDVQSGNSPELKMDFDVLGQRVVDQQNNLAEHDAQVRYYRLEDAAMALAKETDFETRLRAAFALEYDAVALQKFFEHHPQTANENLQGDQIRQNVIALVEAGREDGKDVIYKAKLLHVGMHWWIRGRYGAGPMRWGLLKSPNALLSAKNQFPLYMPVQPVATDPANQQVQTQSPQYDRRHHYICDAEQNQIQDRTATFRTASTFH